MNNFVWKLIFELLKNPFFLMMVIFGVIYIILYIIVKKRSKLIIYEKMTTEVKDADNNKCPECGGTLIQRKGKYGLFLGCSNYPKCNFTKKYKN